MVMGQSAATAAGLALDGRVAVQDVDYSRLRARLVADGQILTWDGSTIYGRQSPWTLASESLVEALRHRLMQPY